MSKLLNCPFCGKRAELRHDKDGFSYIVCANDGCYVRTDGHLNKESAINHWNTRTPMANIVEKLEEEKKKNFEAYNEATDATDILCYGNVVNAYGNSINIVKQEIKNGLE